MKKNLFILAFVSLAFFVASCGSDSDSPDSGGGNNSSKDTGKDYTQSETFELVDMGTSVKWATINLGAEKAYELGNYYQWGNLTVTIGQLGGKYASCRLPSKQEWKELLDACGQLHTKGIYPYAKWGEVKGVKGLLLKSGYNGNIIFLPAAGHQDPYGMLDVGENGYYWLSSSYNAGRAYSIKFMQGAISEADTEPIILGQSVRLVSDK